MCILRIIAVLLLALSQTLIAQTLVPLKQLDRSIDIAANYLVRQTLPNGKFVYRINTNPVVQVHPKYNMLRHAGTMYSLAEYYQLRSSPRVKDTLLRANDFLQSQIAVVKDVPEVLAVWSDPKVNLGEDGRKAKLGATGLGLVALSLLETIEKNTVDKRRLIWLGNFLLFMQKENGDFHSFYLPIFPGRDDSWTSLYYPGEAALGLLLLNAVDQDPEWVTGAYEALSYLARSRRGKTEVPPDHWSLIATRPLLNRDQIDNQDIDTDLLVLHAVQIVRFMLQEQEPQNGHAVLDGCFSNDGRTTPTAARLEGLLAALDFLPPKSEQLRGNVEAACHRGIQFLIDNQISQGIEKGGIPRAVALLTEDQDHPGWDPNFNDRATEIRIDYVQHALSAMIAYRKLFHDKAAVNSP